MTEDMRTAVTELKRPIIAKCQQRCGIYRLTFEFASGWKTYYSRDPKGPSYSVGKRWECKIMSDKDETGVKKA